LAFWTASMARPRMVLIARVSEEFTIDGSRMVTLFQSVP
jgi:hypothetical protein